MGGFDDCQAYALAFADTLTTRQNWDFNTVMKGAAGNLLYGWMAGEVDYCGARMLGDHLREHYTLKSMADLHADDMRTSSAVNQQLEEDKYSLKRQLEHAEKAARRVEVDLQEKLIDKELAWRSEMEKSRRRAAVSHKIQMDVLRGRLSKAELTLDEMIARTVGARSAVPGVTGGEPGVDDQEGAGETADGEAIETDEVAPSPKGVGGA